MDAAAFAPSGGIHRSASQAEEVLALSIDIQIWNDRTLVKRAHLENIQHPRIPVLVDGIGGICAFDQIIVLEPDIDGVNHRIHRNKIRNLLRRDPRGVVPCKCIPVDQLADIDVIFEHCYHILHGFAVILQYQYIGIHPALVITLLLLDLRHTEPPKAENTRQQNADCCQSEAHRKYSPQNDLSSVFLNYLHPNFYSPSESFVTLILSAPPPRSLLILQTAVPKCLPAGHSSDYPSTQSPSQRALPPHQ